MIVFPALYIGSQETLAFARDIFAAGLCARVLPVYRPDFVAVHRPPGQYLIDDFSSVAALCAKLRTWSTEMASGFSAVLGIDDEDQFSFSSELAKALSLSFYSSESLQAASNKYAMKERFKVAGVPSPRFQLLSSVEDASNTELSFPNVLKLVTGSGSEYVFLNQDRRALTDNYKNLRESLATTAEDTRLNVFVLKIGDRQQIIDTRESFLLEEYAGGDEYSCDFLVNKGLVSLLRVTKKFEAGALGLFQGFWLMSSASLKAKGPGESSLVEVCRRVADALMIEDGVCMLDFKLDDDRLQVIETSIRPGFASFMPLMLGLYGYTSLGVGARQLLGLGLPAGLPDKEGLVVNILAPRAGVIRSIDSSALDVLKEDFQLYGSHFYAESGEEIKDISWDRFSFMLGWVAVGLKTGDAPSEVMERVKASVRVEMQDV